MKHSLIPVLLILAALAPSCKKAPAPLQGVIQFVAGDVKLSDGAGEAAAEVGDPVRQEMMITTGDNSFAQVAIGESRVQVYEKSSLVFKTLLGGNGGGAEETGLNVAHGTIFSRVAEVNRSRGDSFKLNSCVMVAAVRGTEFLYTVDCVTGRVICFEGVVMVRAADGTEEIRVNAGEMLSIGPGQEGKITPAGRNYRYGDFEYGKNRYMPEGAVLPGGKDGRTGLQEDGASGGEQETASTKSRYGGQGSTSTAEKRTSGSSAIAKKEQGASSTTAKRSTDAASMAKKEQGGTSTASKKTSGTSAIAKKEQGGTAAEQTSVKRKDASAAADSTAAVKKETASRSKTTASDKKETSTDAGKLSAAKKETASKESALAKKEIASNETAAAKKGTAVIASKTVKPGGLLDKPRVELPEVK